MILKFLPHSTTIFQINVTLLENFIKTTKLTFLFEFSYRPRKGYERFWILLLNYYFVIEADRTKHYTNKQILENDAIEKIEIVILDF